MPTAITVSLPTILAFSRRRLFMACNDSVAEQNDPGHEANEEGRRHGGQQQRHATVGFFLVSSHVHAPCQPITRVAVASSLGGFSNVWKGAGEGTPHSRPSAPSHGLAGALAPLPRMQGSTTNTKKYTCARPKPSEPMEAIALKSANCMG